MATNKSKGVGFGQPQGSLSFAALNSLSTAVTVADANLGIMFANAAAVDLFRGAESAYQTMNPSFSAPSIVGALAWSLHPEPAGVQQFAASNQEQAEFRFLVGHRSLEARYVRMPDGAPGEPSYTIEWIDRTAALEAESQRAQEERESARIRTALDNATTNVMIADTNLNIIYMNRSVERTLRRAAADIQKELPGFDVDKLVGANIDIFHRNPAHQRRVISETRVFHETTVNVGGRVFHLRLNPARDGQGQPLGYALEWNDRTDQVRAEGEIARTLQAAASGNLSQRLDLSSLEGFMKRLGENINELLNTVVAPIRETVRVVECLAEGDLSSKLSGDYQGEFGALQTAVNSFITSQNDILRQVNLAATQVATASDQLRGTSHRLAEGAQMMGSALQESTSGLEETSSMVRANAESARVANGLTVSTVETVELGKTKMTDMVASMGRITQCSQQIARIIKVIDEIAFQTNLLALNAAVEAARAGRHGRGFAVVAQEVRNLAERSAKAAKETSELIQGAMESVREGSEATAETSEVLGDIAMNIAKVRDIVAEISAASDEQARGVSEISASMAQINDSAQAVQEQSVEVAGASEELRQQTSILTEALSGFQLAAPPADPATSGLAGFPPELLPQLLALLKAQGAPIVETSRVGFVPPAPPSARKKVSATDPRKVLPLDEDERGYGEF